MKRAMTFQSTILTSGLGVTSQTPTLKSILGGL